MTKAFQLQANYRPTGDQPEAIRQLAHVGWTEERSPTFPIPGGGTSCR